MVWFFSSNTSLIRQRRSERDALIAKATDHLSSLSSSSDSSTIILSSTIEELVEGIKQKRWTSTEVVTTFIRQAIVAHRQTNCLTEVNFEAAWQRAQELDADFAKTGQLTGPLHGIPFSLKDQFHLKDKRSATGYSEWLKLPPQKDNCAIAQVAVHLGAICIAKTNVPQTMLNFECRNPAWGQTTNPFSDAHTCGGSSGGEAALLSIGGSAFGIGSDIGGSLRIPTSYCGIYALKTSNDRSFPKAGTISFGPGQTAVKSVAGPMTRCLADLELLMRLFTDTLNPPTLLDDQRGGQVSLRQVQRRFGAEIAPYMPLQQAWFDPLRAAAQRSLQPDGTPGTGSAQPIRIGWYTTDGYIQQTPTSLRAMEMVKDALTNHVVDRQGNPAKVELVPVDAKRLQVFETFRVFVGLTSIDKYAPLKRPLGADSIDRALKLPLWMPSLRLLRFLLGFIARWLLRDPYPRQFFGAMGQGMAHKYFGFEAQRDNLVDQFDQNVWQALQLDAIVCPVQASPALPHYGSAVLGPLASSTILYNVLRNPAAVVPVTRVDRALDNHRRASPARSKWQHQTDVSTTSAFTNLDLNRQFDADKMHGLPFGVQVVTREYEDEKAIGMARLVDDALAQRNAHHRQQFGPGAWQRWTGGQQK